MQKVDVNLLGADGGTLTILEGKALEQKPPQKINLAGDIKTVSNFLKVRKEASTGGSGLQTVDLSKAVVLVDKNAMTIELILDPENHYGATVKGTLELSEEIKKWHINEEFTFKLNEFKQLVRFNKLDFDTSEKYDMLFSALQKFNVKSFIDSSQEADTRGNKNTSFQKKVETGIPMDFVLNIPVFKRFDSVRFGVEIALETLENYVNFWLESVPLAELIKTEKERIFEEQLAFCDGFVIINK